MVLASNQAMQIWRAGKCTGTQTGTQLLTGLCLIFFGLVFTTVSVKGRPFGGFLAVTDFNFNGNNALIDSFDSSDPTHSAWQSNWFFNGQNYGTYTSSRRTAEVIVGTDGSILNVGNALIYGYVYTGPGGSVSIQKNGSVGDLNWVPTPGIQTSPTNHLRDDMNMMFDDVVLPAGTNSYYPTTPWALNLYYTAGTNIGGVVYNYMITNIIGMPGTPKNKIYYTVPTAVLNNIYISASNVVLYLPNGVNMGPIDNITLETNSSVDIYTGSDFNTGNGSVNNMTQYAPALKIYGLPGCSVIIFGGNAVLTTWLYAPEASLSFNGGGSGAYNVVGALMCHDLALNGHFNFHYDTALSWNIPTPPQIYTLQSNQVVQLGSNATFTVLNDGDTPLYYQWLLNQTNLVAGNTNFPTLLLTNVQLSDAGNYSVIVTNLYGSVTSAPASLVVYTDATPALSIDWASTNGRFQFDVSGVSGLNYSVQTSTNLIDWVPLETNVAPFTFLDTNVAFFPQRFYRSVFVP